MRWGNFLRSSCPSSSISTRPSRLSADACSRRRCPSPKCGHGEPTSTPTPAGSPLFRRPSARLPACHRPQRISSSILCCESSSTCARRRKGSRSGAGSSSYSAPCLRLSSRPGRTLARPRPHPVSKNPTRPQSQLLLLYRAVRPQLVNPSVGLQKKAYKVRRVLDLSTRSPDSPAMTAVPVARCSRLCWRHLFRLACLWKCVVLSTRPSRRVHPRACANGWVAGRACYSNLRPHSSSRRSKGASSWRCALDGERGRPTSCA